MFIYKAGFTLVNSFTYMEDFSRSVIFLQDVNMKKDFILDGVANKVNSIKWVLTSFDRGNAVVETNEELTDEEMLLVVDWLRDRTSYFDDYFEVKELAELNPVDMK